MGTPGRTRTGGLLLRRQVPSPLGHRGVAPAPGFEPGLTVPKAAVLPITPSGTKVELTGLEPVAFGLPDRRSS